MADEPRIRVHPIAKKRFALGKRAYNACKNPDSLPWEQLSAQERESCCTYADFVNFIAKMAKKDAPV